MRVSESADLRSFDLQQRGASPGVVLVHEEEKKNNANGKLVIECLSVARGASCAAFRDASRALRRENFTSREITRRQVGAPSIAINRQTFNETEHSTRAISSSFFSFSFLSRRRQDVKTASGNLSSRTAGIQFCHPAAEEN